MNRLLAEFGVKNTTLVAWVGAQPLFMARIAPSPQAYQSSFYPHNPTSILCHLMLDVETQVWRGSVFDPF